MRAGARSVYAHRSAPFQGAQVFLLGFKVFSLTGIRLGGFCGPYPLKKGIVPVLQPMTIGTYDRVRPKRSEYS